MQLWPLYTISALSVTSTLHVAQHMYMHVHVLCQSIECPTIGRKMVYIVRLCATCVCEPTIICMKSRENQNQSCHSWGGYEHSEQ